MKRILYDIGPLKECLTPPATQKLKKKKVRPKLIRAKSSVLRPSFHNPTQTQLNLS